MIGQRDRCLIMAGMTLGLGLLGVLVTESWLLRGAFLALMVSSLMVVRYWTRDGGQERATLRVNSAT